MSDAGSLWISIRMDSSRRFALVVRCLPQPVEGGVVGTKRMRDEPHAVKREGTVVKREKLDPPLAKGDDGVTLPAGLEGFKHTSPTDRVRFTLVQVAGAAASPLQAWSTASSIVVSNLCPPGMDTQVYCRLLDSVLRLSGGAEEAGQQLSVVVGSPSTGGEGEAAKYMQRVELRLSLPVQTSGGPSSLLLCALELYPEETVQLAPTGSEKPQPFVAGIFSSLEAQLSVFHQMQRVATQQAREIRKLKAHIDYIMSKKLDEDALLTLEAVQALVNEKKAKIAELTEALRQSRSARPTCTSCSGLAHTVSTAPPVAQGNSDRGSDTVDDDDQKEEEGGRGYSTGASDTSEAPGDNATATTSVQESSGVSGGKGKDSSWIDDIFSVS